MSQKTSALVWIAIALGLVILFNAYPNLAAAIPDWSILIVTAIVVVYVIRAKRDGKLQKALDTKVVFGISAKHLMLIGAALFCTAFLLMALILQFIEDKNSTELVGFVIAPALLLIITGAICLGCGFYPILRR